MKTSPPAPISIAGGGTKRLPAVDRNARVAIVHDWLPNMRGGERVLARICRLFPNGEVFTLFDMLPDEVKEQHFPGVRFHVSAANRLPGVGRYYRSLFFLCPFLIEQFDVTEYDAVISSSAAFARGVLTRPDQPHLCYVHSPVRYAWDQQFSYLQQGRLGFGPTGLAFRYMLHKLRNWDTRTANGPHVMVANSSYVRARVQRIYGRRAGVVHPPVNVDELQFSAEKEDYFVTAAFHVPYKRTDLVVEAFSRMPSRRLIVVGDELQSKHLRDVAGPNVTFAGYLPRDQYMSTIARAKALVFAGCEDFGIAMAEAQAYGTPLIAFGRGGVRDIVAPLGTARQPTGVFFERQTVEDLMAAVDRFEDDADLFTPEACRMNAKRFSEDRFDFELLSAFEKAQRVCAAELLPQEEEPFRHMPGDVELGREPA